MSKKRGAGKARNVRRPRGHDGLTAKQEAFAQAYVLDGNGAGAYLAAYPASAKWTPQARAEQAWKQMQNPKIRQRVDELRDKVARVAEDRFAIKAERVLGELARIGYSNMLDYVRLTSGGEPMVDLSKLDRDSAAAIAEVTVEDFTEGRGEDARDVRRVKFKLHDKRGALRDIGQHLGLFKMEHELGGKNGGPIQVVFTDADARL